MNNRDAFYITYQHLHAAGVRWPCCWTSIAVAHKLKCQQTRGAIASQSQHARPASVT